MIAAASWVERLWDDLKENPKIWGNIEEVQSLHVLHCSSISSWSIWPAAWLPRCTTRG
jgi:hypothetical protein